MDRRSLRELELLDVVELYGLRLAAPLVQQTKAGITEGTEDSEGTEKGRACDCLVVGDVAPGTDAEKLLESMLAAIGLAKGRDYRVAGMVDEGSLAGVRLILALDTESAGRARSLEGPGVVRLRHPAELLASPMDKAKAWEELLLARRTLG